MKRRTRPLALLPVLLAVGMLTILRRDDPAREISTTLQGYERRASREDANVGPAHLRVTMTHYVASDRGFADEIARVRRTLSAPDWIEYPGSSGARVFKRRDDSSLIAMMRTVPVVRGFILERMWSLRVEPGLSGGVAATDIRTDAP